MVSARKPYVYLIYNPMVSTIQPYVCLQYNPMLTVPTASLVSCLFLRRLYRTWRNKKILNKRKDSRPTIAFGGAASMWPYYCGVFYYLSSHFHLGSRVRATGISLGVTSAYALALDIPFSQKFEMALTWGNLIWSRPLRCFFMSPNELIDSGLKVTQKFGITDSIVREAYANGTVYVGCTDIGVLPWEHVLLSPDKDCRYGRTEHKPSLLPQTLHNITQA
jgi:hypothetical protein